MSAIVIERIAWAIAMFVVMWLAYRDGFKAGVWSERRRLAGYAMDAQQAAMKRFRESQSEGEG